jgi:seryl-tRNA synthetase
MDADFQTSSVLTLRGHALAVSRILVATMPSMQQWHTSVTKLLSPFGDENQCVEVAE